MANKNGEISWDDKSFDNSEKKSGKDTFLRLSPGSNIVRVLTLPHQYNQHKVEIEGGKKYGYRINCSGTSDCPVCKDGNKAKRRWFLGCIDRKTNAYKVLDIGYSVFKSIQTYARDSDWGDPSSYDLDIVVDPSGGATGYYSVVCKPAKPLSANDLLLRDQNDPSELARRVVPPTTEKVAERLTRISEEIAATGFVSTGVSKTANSTVATAIADDDDSDDNYFKNYDATAKKAPF
jgi:hypothetical protein